MEGPPNQEVGNGRSCERQIIVKLKKEAVKKKILQRVKKFDKRFAQSLYLVSYNGVQYVRAYEHGILHSEGRAGSAAPYSSAKEGIKPAVGQEPCNEAGA